jgi:hypothetical protein
MNLITLINRSVIPLSGIQCTMISQCFRLYLEFVQNNELSVNRKPVFIVHYIFNPKQVPSTASTDLNDVIVVFVVSVVFKFGKERKTSSHY